MSGCGGLLKECSCSTLIAGCILVGPGVRIKDILGCTSLYGASTLFWRQPYIIESTNTLS